MIKCFFNDLENVTIENLRKAKRSIRAAVAWINFNHYKDVFDELLNKGVEVKIILNNCTGTAPSMNLGKEFFAPEFNVKAREATKASLPIKSMEYVTVLPA